MPNSVDLKSRPIIVALLLALFFSLSFIAPAIENSSLRMPPELGDGPDYDNLAINLALGKGFGFDWNEPVWRGPYDAEQYAGLLQRQGDFYSSAYRPPLYPLVLAASYLTFGPNFSTPRILNALFLAITITLCVLFLWQNFSGLAASAAAILCTQDFSFRLWSHSFYAEALICLLVTALLLTFFSKQSPYKKALYAGLLIGCLCLSKSIFILWLPFIAFLLFWNTRIAFSKPLKLQVYFLASFLIILTPWAIRNSLLSDGLLPLGTQGGPNLAYEYSDTALAAKGLWLGVYNSKALAEIYAQSQQYSGFKQELVLNQLGTASAKSWITNNYHLLPKLFSYKVFGLWWRDTLLFQKFLVCLALCGLFWSYRNKRDLFYITAAFLLAQTLAVGLTHTVPAGRFLMPLYPVLLILAGITISAILENTSKTKREARILS